MGMIPGIISCAFSGSTAALGLYLLSRCATQVGRPAHLPPPGGKSSGAGDEAAHSDAGDAGHDHATPAVEASFNTVALLTFGQGWATRCFDAAIAIKCFGVSVSYLIIVKVNLLRSHHLPRRSFPRPPPHADPHAAGRPLPLAPPPRDDPPRALDVA